MKSFLFVCFIIILLINPRTSASAEGDSLFTGNQVHSINIIFSIPNYWDSLTYYYNQGDEQYLAASVIANGVTYNNVGVRLKGNSSYTHPNNKKSFRLSFNEFVSGQRWDGLKGVHLNNFWNDPSFVREKLHLDLCKSAGIAAPRCNFVRLSINDTLFAFYSLIEHVDKTFLNSRFGNDEGDQFKAVDGIGASSDFISDFRWLGSDSTTYFDYYELKSEEETGPWKKLINLIDTLNHSSNVSASLPGKLNMNTFNNAMATDVIMGNLDAYLYTGRNFYFYFVPPTYKMEWIVWDASLSFGALPGSPANIETLPVDYVVSDTGRPLFSKVLNNPVLKDEYLHALCNITSTYFSTALLFPKIDSIVTLIRPYVYEDQRKMFTNSQFETNVISDIIVSGRRIPGVKSFISLRKSSIQSQLNALGITCDVGIIPNEISLAKSFELSQNFPNPFNPSTQIEYSLFNPGNVTLKIYDNLGKDVMTLVNNIYQNEGRYHIQWNGKDNEGAQLSSGIYFYKLIVNSFGETNSNSVTRRMILIK